MNVGGLHHERSYRSWCILGLREISLRINFGRVVCDSVACRGYAGLLARNGGLGEGVSFCLVLVRKRERLALISLPPDHVPLLLPSTQVEMGSFVAYLQSAASLSILPSLLRDVLYRCFAGS